MSSGNLLEICLAVDTLARQIKLDGKSIQLTRLVSDLAFGVTTMGT